MKCSLGISTCPNDTFAFHAILEKRIDTLGLEFDVELLDVQHLNGLVASRSIDLSKISYYAALRHAEVYAMLGSGCALGYGVGPLLLARPGAPALTAACRVLAPGDLTTAYFLLRSFFPEATRIEHTVFSEIMPALERGDADYGVVIHEGRFTYARHGLKLVADLGDLWEQRHNLPLPLGGIAGRLDLGPEVLSAANAVVRDSVAYARDHREETYATMARYALELSPEVIWSHVDLYVNEWTLSLGPVGTQAVRTFEAAARQSGLVEEGTPGLTLVKF